jgi:hypothetical protein
MALVKGTNSYANVAEADAYFGNRLNSGVWTGATTPDKEKALITATGIVDDNQWEGSVVSDTQSLAFPRIGSYFDTRLGFTVEFDDVDPPKRVIDAVYETAIHLLTDSGVLDTSSSVESISIDGISLTKIKSNSKIPSAARAMILPILVRSSSVWWRAN